jgi:hypothetical protein
VDSDDDAGAPLTPADTFRAKILAGTRCTGIFLSLGSAVAAEFASSSGFDYVVSVVDVLEDLRVWGGGGSGRDRVA